MNTDRMYPNRVPTVISIALWFSATAWPQPALLEDFATVRTAIGSTTPIWGVYTGQGGTGNPCINQTWNISGNMGNVVMPSNSCPYMNIQIGNEGGTPGGYLYPNGYVQSYLKSGTWTPNFNRFTFSMNCGTSWGVQATTSTMGTYIRNHTDANAGAQGAHYYHLMANAVNANQWYYFTMNAHPGYQVGYSSNINWPNDPEWVLPSQMDSTLQAVHYYDGLSRFYINPYFAALPIAFGCQFGSMSFATVSGEPDEDVSTVAGSYDGSSYHVDWSGPKFVSESYTVKYATASMHVNGFSTGTACGATPTTQNDAYSYVNWTCKVAQAPSLYVAIRPQPIVIGSTGNAVSPIRLSLMVDPMWAAGDQVIVSGAGGNTAANGTWSVTPHPRQFWRFLDSSLTAVAVSGGTALITTASPHNLEPGQVIMIYNSSGSENGQWGYAPTTTVLGVPSSTTFTVSTSEAAGMYTNSTTPNLQVWSLPTVDLQGTTGNGEWTGGGVAQATSNINNFTEVLIPSPSYPCDLNADGLVNQLDVALALQMALGQLGCTANLDRTGICDVVDVQRVTNSALGQPCRVGP